MPPAAISRSSTYFPKICGNIRVAQRSAFPALLLAFACGPKEPAVVTLEVRLHEHAGCPLPDDKSEVAVLLQPLGPFPRVSPVTLPATATGRPLDFPEETLGLEVRVVDDEQNGWIGQSERATPSGFDVLLWREGAVCTLPELGDDYPGTNGGQALGYSASAGVVLAAGADLTTSSSAWGFAFDLGSGSSGAVAGSDVGLARPRAHATVTEFGDGLLVAGGESPLSTGVPEDERAIEATAQVYRPALAGFAPEIIELVVGRTRHAALTLPSGDTLLVGGRSGFRELALNLEAVSPRTLLAQLGELASLRAGRVNPSALRLDDGRILVAGGFDTEGTPVSELEWFSADARELLELRAALPLLEEPAFTALPGGGALAVGRCPRAADPRSLLCGCPVDDPNGEPDDSECPSTHGAVWIDADGALSPFPLHVPDCPTARAELAAGSNGSPWLFLIAGDEQTPCRRRFRFNPWQVRLAPAGEAPEIHPQARPLSLGADHFAFITDEDPPRFAGTRAGVRGAWSAEGTTPLVEAVDASDPTRPLHLVPDRPPGDSVVFDAASRPRRLILRSGGGVRVFASDARYGDVTVRLELAPAEEGEPRAPIVLFGDAPVGNESEGEPCSWPATGGRHFSAVRRGNTVTLERDETNESGACVVPEGFVPFGVRAPSGAGPDVELSSIAITRN